MTSLTTREQTREPEQLRRYFHRALTDCRRGTLTLVENISPDVLTRQAHPDFSPVGWHLGHIAFTESLWILEHLAQQPCPFPQYRRLFAADGLPKDQRQQLPPLAELLSFMASVRQRVVTYLAAAPVNQQRRLWHWLLQHESQHSETLTLVLALHRLQGRTTPLRAGKGRPGSRPGVTDMAAVAGGHVWLGYDDDRAIDNERPRHRTEVAPFWIDRTPVTVAQYQTFMEAEGYGNRRWWTAEGWQWRQSHRVTRPLYWSLEQQPTAPVCGVSWYEASAYARFRGKRLPTEAEWAMAAQGLERRQEQLLTSANCDHRSGAPTPVAADDGAVSDWGCYDLLGQVWEWTDSWFRPYPGFVAYPYRGYSETYFDDRHRVLRGGCWASRPWTLRPSFRNWYHPHVREIFTGFRCASDYPIPSDR